MEEKALLVAAINEKVRCGASTYIGWSNLQLFLSFSVCMNVPFPSFPFSYLPSLVVPRLGQDSSGVLHNAFIGYSRRDAGARSYSPGDIYPSLTNRRGPASKNA